MDGMHIGNNIVAKTVLNKVITTKIRSALKENCGDNGDADMLIDQLDITFINDKINIDIKCNINMKTESVIKAIFKGGIA